MEPNRKDHCSLLLIAACALFAQQALAQPSGDECAEAIPLVSHTTCEATSADTYGATQSIEAITCNLNTGNADDDVWFNWVATETVHTIVVHPSAQFDAVIDVRSGSCGSTVNIGCSDEYQVGTPETYVMGGLTIGETYFVRVYDYATGFSPTTSFNICILDGVVDFSGIEDTAIARPAMTAHWTCDQVVVDGWQGQHTAQVCIVDALGRNVFGPTAIPASPGSIQLQVAQLPAGVYRVQVGDASITGIAAFVRP